MVNLANSFPEERESPGKRVVVGKNKVGFALTVLLPFPVLLFLFFVSAVQAGPAPELKPSTYGYFDFATCVRYALTHSKDFLRNRLDIQVRSLDLKDAHAEIMPTVKIETLYFIDRASRGDEDSPFGVTITATQWNPYLALLKVRSKEIVVDMAKLAHADKINKGVADMAKTFYRIHLLKKQIRAGKEVTALLQRKIDFGATRIDQGGLDELTVRMWKNTRRGEQLEIARLEKKLEAEIANLKLLMGYHPDYHLPLDTRNAVNQVLGGFKGNLIAFSDIQGRNLNLQLKAKREQLQSNEITGAYVALLPQPKLQADALANQPDRTSGFNLAVGVEALIWDGFRRVRDIKRKKMVARQLNIDRHQLSRNLYNQYRALQSQLDVVAEQESFFRERTRLAEMQEQKAFFTFKSGEGTFDLYMDAKVQRARNNAEYVGVSRDRVMALIDLATLAGGLNKYNAGIGF